MTIQIVALLCAVAMLVTLTVALMWNKRNVEAQIAKDAAKDAVTSKKQEETIIEMRTMRMYDLDITPILSIEVVDAALVRESYLESTSAIRHYYQHSLERFIEEIVARQTPEKDGKAYLLQEQESICEAAMVHLNKDTPTSGIAIVKVSYTVKEPS